MKTWQRHTLFLISVALICVGTALVLNADRKDRESAECRDIAIVINGEQEFVTQEDVRRYISEEYGQCVGKRADSIGLAEIEDILDSKSAVRKSEAWMTKDGVMHISINQRKPVALFRKTDYGFYVDDRGCIFPLHPTYTAPVPQISGAIPVNPGSRYKGPPATSREKAWIDGVTGLLDYIQSTRQWNGRFSSITVRSNGDLALVSAEGAETFIFGAPTEYREKFTRISKYYSEIAPLREEGYYKSVNVKFNGQIVCRK